MGEEKEVPDYMRKRRGKEPSTADGHKVSFRMSWTGLLLSLEKERENKSTVMHHSDGKSISMTIMLKQA